MYTDNVSHIHSMYTRLMLSSPNGTLAHEHVHQLNSSVLPSLLQYAFVNLEPRNIQYTYFLLTFCTFRLQGGSVCRNKKHLSIADFDIRRKKSLFGSNLHSGWVHLPFDWYCFPHHSHQIWTTVSILHHN